MSTRRNNARIAGILILIPFVTYGAGSGLVASVVEEPGYLLHWPAGKMQLRAGALLMLINSFCVAGIGMVLYPVLKQRSTTIAAGYLGARIMESVILAVGVISLLLLLGIGDAYPASTAPVYLEASGALSVKSNYYAYQVAMMVLGLGSTVFCMHLFRYRLIPRYAAIWGVAGYGLLLAGAVLELFGLHVGVLLSLPGGLFELFLAGWLIFKGISPAVMPFVNR